MLAGVMLAASCSKDDGTAVVDEIVVPNETPEAVAEQPAAQKTYPFSVQASKETSISKIALDGYDLKFDGGETLLLVLDGDETKYVELDFVSGAGTTTATFSKDLSEDEKTLIEGKKLWGVIKGKSSLDEVQYSTTSLEDAVNLYCSLRSTEAITYEDGKASDDLTLADEKAYIEFNVADGQKQVSLKRADKSEYSWYPVNEENDQVWFVVPGNEKYNTRLKKKTLTAEKGKVYTLTEKNVVDLGLSVLWCTSNANSPETDQKSFAEAQALAAGVSGYDLPSDNNFKELKNTTTTFKKDGTGFEKGCTFETTYGKVFFPAAGKNDGTVSVGSEGYYWTSSYNNVVSGSETYIQADYLYFWLSDNSVIPQLGRVDGKEFSVRLVRSVN